MTRRSLPLMIAALLLVGVVIVVLMVGDLITLAELKARRDSLESAIAARPMVFTALFIIAFALIAALAPGAAVLKVAAGALFGFWAGVGVSLAATLMAAVIGFLLARYAMRHWVERRFAAIVERVNRGVGRDGALYVVAMRFNPLVPFFLINFGMGLTRMRLPVFTAASFVGLIPASFVYANAGTELAQIDVPSDILSVRLIGSLVLLSLMPIAGRWAARWLRGPRIAAPDTEL